MLHQLKIEWLKVKNYRTFWVLSILFVVSLFGINYIPFQIHSFEMSQRQLKGGELANMLGTPWAFPEVWQTVTFMSSFLLFILGLLIIISVTNEFSYKTHRQNIIDGLSRTQFITTKMMLAVILSAVATLLVFLTALFFGLGGEASFSTDGIRYISYYFLQALSYTSVALVFSLLFRRSGIAIGVFFLYMLVIDELLATLLKRYVGQIGYFMPLETNDVMIPFPFGKNITEMLIKRPDVTYLLIASGVYLVGYFFFSKRRFETADL